MESAQAPVELSLRIRGREPSPEACLEGVRHHLLEGRISDQEVVDHARSRRAGASEFERGRSAVCLRIAGVGREGWGQFVGKADDRVETLKLIVAVKFWGLSCLIGQVDLGIVEAAT